MMRIGSAVALGVALAGIAAPAIAKEKAPKEAPAKVTPAVATGYTAAKKALDGGDVATATTQYQALKGQVQTDDDKLFVGQLAVNIGQKNNDQAILREGIDMMLASNKVPDNQKGQLYGAQGRLAYQAKDYRTAEASLTQAQQSGYKDDQLVPLIVSSMQFNGQTVKALQTLNAAIDANAAANTPTPAEWFQRGLAIGYGAKPADGDPAQIVELTSNITKKWVAAYPTKNNWHDAMITFISQAKPTTDVQIDVFRLLRKAGALAGDADYREYAEDVYLRYPNEAKTVLEEGVSKGVVNAAGKGSAGEILAVVNPKIAADKASLVGASTKAKAAADGKSALTTADALVGYGRYPEAIELYKVAIQKGGVDVPTANLHMGWAMALAGDAAGAKQQFATVTGVRKTVADFWVVHLDHPTAG